ncbi:hypothetical protein [Acinetobacter sp. ASP199]|uniref:hypothetical protein n=1 Tax=unclassified Acinetobacter TaxID=196816 RepID=UPI001F621488|nr:hypothetical protein [Acinetobacter sp. ASP199]
MPTGRILNAYQPAKGHVQFLLDNNNFGNPVDLHNLKKLESLRLALAQAKILKIDHTGELYTFQNRQANQLSRPMSCME